MRRPANFRLALAIVAVMAGAATTAAAVELEDMKMGTEILVGSGAICAGYLKKPEILDGVRRSGLTNLTGAGLSEDEANALKDGAVKEALSEQSTETQMQMACEFAGIKALPEPSP